MNHRDDASLEAVRERRYLKDGHGNIRGADAFADAFSELWMRTPGQRWLGRLTHLPLVGSIAGMLYDAFARALYRWNRRQGHS